MSENFILLAHDKTCFYFLHIIQDLESYNSMKYPLGPQVYNCMISDQRISSFDQHCIVWTVYPDGKIITIISNHELSSINIIHIDEEKFAQCMRSQIKERKLIFQFDYNKDQFDIYDVEVDTANIFYNLNSLTFVDIVKYKTIKPISYLIHQKIHVS